MTHQTLSRAQHVGTADAQALKLSRSGNVMLRSLSTTEEAAAQHFYELREASLLCQTVRDISQHADALRTTYQG